MFRVCNQTRETSLGDRIRLADTSLSRFVGLIGARTLPPGGGLWIVPSNGVHTFGMLFPIDVVFLDADHRVVGLRENLRPFWLTGLNWRARSVLELPPATIHTSRTEIGDHLSISD